MAFQKRHLHPALGHQAGRQDLLLLGLAISPVQRFALHRLNPGEPLPFLFEAEHSLEPLLDTGKM